MTKSGNIKKNGSISKVCYENVTELVAVDDTAYLKDTRIDILVKVNDKLTEKSKVCKLFVALFVFVSKLCDLEVIWK